MERLRVAEGRTHGLHAGARDIVERILCRQRPAGRLAVRAERHRLRVLRAERLDDLCPEHAGGAHLRDFHEIVFADGPEEREALRECINRQAGLDARADVFEAVGERVAELDVRRRASFLHVVAGDGDAVEFRHVLRRVFEDVADDAHGHVRRVDVRVAHHELFEDVVLDRAGHDLRIDALLDAGLDVERENRQHGAVHRHRDGHLVERDARKQDVHVEHGADGDACLADIAEHARVVGVIAAMRRQVKRDGKAFLAGGEVAAVEGVRFLGRREAGVLAHGPGAEDVHRRVRPAQAWRDAAREVEVVHVVIFFMVVKRLDGDVLHRAARELVEALASFFFKQRLPFGFRVLGRRLQPHLREIGVRHQSIIPFFFCRASRIS